MRTPLLSTRTVGAAVLAVTLSALGSESHAATIITPDLTTGGTATGGPGAFGGGGGESPDKAFDDLSTTKLLVNTNPSPTTPVFAIYDFAGTATQTVASYSLTSANDGPERDPADIQLQGSNNPGDTTPTWTTIDTRTGIDFVDDSMGIADAGTSDRFETLFFTVDAGNRAAYQAYRLLINETADPTNTVPQIAEIQLFNDVRVPEPGSLAAVAFGALGLLARRRRTA